MLLSIFNKGEKLKSVIYVLVTLVVGVLIYQGASGTSRRANLTQKNTTTYQVTQKTTETKTDGIVNVKVNPRNVIFFDVPVEATSVDEAVSILSTLSGDIYLVLNSPGGSVIDGARLINYIKHSGKNINTVCDNFCASMAFQIFEVGKKRYMVDNAMLMAHPASGGAQGTIENMASMLNSFKKYIDRMDAETAARSGIEYSKFKAMVADNVWVDTSDALQMRLADDMIFLELEYPVMKQATPNFGNSIKNILNSKGLLTPKLLDTKGYIFKTN